MKIKTEQNPIRTQPTGTDPSGVSIRTMKTARSVGSSEEAKFKGVRKRKWGKWVSEVRLPNSRERIWLGSYDSPEKAARAFDAAAFCLRGQRARLNFPDNLPAVPTTGGSLTCLQIQELATSHAHSVETTMTTITTAADAEETERATSSENSPSEEVDAVGAATAIDWSFLDMTNGGFHSMMDDFGYDHFMALPPSLLSPTMGPTDGEGEEGASGCGSRSSLWNF